MKKFSILLVVGCWLLVVGFLSSAYAVCPPCPGPGASVCTALGCVPTEKAEFVVWVLARAIGIGGGIAFLLMLWGGFQVITSSGDPQKLQSGKETITSALMGLLFIIFSLFLLELIGVKILQIKGF